MISPNSVKFVVCARPNRARTHNLLFSDKSTLSFFLRSLHSKWKYPMKFISIFFGFLVLVFGTVPATAVPVVLATQIRALDLFGDGAYGPIELHLTPGTTSTGRTVIAPDGTAGDLSPGNGQHTVLSSFFDVFFDITSTPSPLVPSQTTSNFGRIALAGPCENPFAFAPVPPGCTYFGHPVFPVEDVFAFIVRHLVFLPSVIFIPPLPGFDFAEMFDTTLQIDTNPARGYTLTGDGMKGMKVDARVVPEPSTLLLVGLALASLACRRVGPSRRPGGARLGQAQVTPIIV